MTNTIPISQLPAASLPITGNEFIPMVQNGVTVKTTALSLSGDLSAIGSNGVSASTVSGVTTISGITATPSQIGVVKPDGTTITASGGIISVPTATSSNLGLVEPDGTIITVSAGTITVPKASNSVFGVVEVDNTSITASSGVISAAAGGLTGTTLKSTVVTSSLTTVGTIGTGVWQGTAVAAGYGGTGGSSAASTGVAQISSGTWSYSTALASGTTATTQSANDSSTKVATTAFANPSASLNTNGYVKLPSGLIIQWGQFTSNATTGVATAVSFAESFPTNAWSLCLSVNNGSVNPDSSWYDALTTSGFNGHAVATGSTVTYMAIGN